jgi:hypothetical protein
MNEKKLKQLKLNLKRENLRTLTRNEMGLAGGGAGGDGDGPEATPSSPWGPTVH